MGRKFKATYQLRENGSFYQELVKSYQNELLDAVADVVRRVESASPKAINISVELI